MRAGRLDRRITIQNRSITQSDSGEEVVTWVDVATVWAEKIELRGDERFAAKQYIGHAIKTFKIRWSETVSELTVLHKIRFDGRDHDITDVRELNRRQGIEIDCYALGELPLVVVPEGDVFDGFTGLDFSQANNSGYVPLLEDI